MKTNILLLALLAIIPTGNAFASVVKVDEPKVCFACHDNIEALNKKKFVHTAFKQGVCSACHNPHASKHASLIKEDIKDLCLSCHDNIKQQVHKNTVHQPAADGNQHHRRPARPLCLSHGRHDGRVSGDRITPL